MTAEDEMHLLLGLRILCNGLALHWLYWCSDIYEGLGVGEEQD